MRRWTRATGTMIGLAAVLTLTVSGCSSPTPGQAVAAGQPSADPTKGQTAPPSTSSSPLLDSKVFLSERGGFSIQPPKGWTVDTGGRFSTDVIFFNTRPESDRTGSFNANITVVRPPDVPSLEVLVGAVKAQIIQQFPGYQPVEDTPAGTIGGQRAHLLGGRFTQNGQQLRDLRLIVVDSGHGYVVTGTTLESYFFRNEAIFRASLPTLSTAK